jgi:hypothetical protein
MSSPEVFSPSRRASNPLGFASMRSTNESGSGRRRPVKRDRGFSRGTTSSPSDIPPSVAAILQATAIPMPRRRQQGSSLQKTVFVTSRPTQTTSVSHDLEKSHLDILLSGPEDLDSDEITTCDEICGSPVSVDSSLPTPSLESDDGLRTASSDFSIRISVSSRPYADKRQKLRFTSEPCASDHPLLLADDFENLEISISDAVTSLQPTSTQFNHSFPFRSFPKLRDSFKSNLTSSLRALRAAAQTVSNFTSPSIWVIKPDPQSNGQPIFHISPELTDDKRPKLLNETPSPALRRYLNPDTTSRSAINSYHRSSQGRQKPLLCISSIQMQTYPSSRNKANSASPPVPRHREPRENSDFLRMLVLELNMRRRGKLRPNEPGKARVWLPPRRADISSRLCSADATGDAPACVNVPQRWVSLHTD